MEHDRPIAHSRAVLVLLVLGFAIFAVPVYAWNPTPLIAFGEREAVAAADRNPCGAITTGCRTLPKNPASANPQSLGSSQEPNADRSGKAGSERRIPVPRLELRVHQELSLRSGRPALVAVIAGGAGMDSPASRTEKAPVWARQLHSERREKVRN